MEQPNTAMNDTATSPKDQQSSQSSSPTGAVTTTAHGVAQSRSLFDREILRQAFFDSFKKLDP
ncbi:MAG: hypothetical protein ABSA91_19625, partial [Acidimicrobiales bacterium]